jgi:hypothetical protein
MARHALPFYALRAGHPWNGHKAISGVARKQGGGPVAVYYPFGHPMPYAYDYHMRIFFKILDPLKNLGRVFSGAGIDKAG